MHNFVSPALELYHLVGDLEAGVAGAHNEKPAVDLAPVGIDYIVLAVYLHRPRRAVTEVLQGGDLRPVAEDFYRFVIVVADDVVEFSVHPDHFVGQVLADKERLRRLVLFLRHYPAVLVEVNVRDDAFYLHEVEPQVRPVDVARRVEEHEPAFIRDIREKLKPVESHFLAGIALTPHAGPPGEHDLALLRDREAYVSHHLAYLRDIGGVQVVVTVHAGVVLKGLCQRLYVEQVEHAVRVDVNVAHVFRLRGGYRPRFGHGVGDQVDVLVIQYAVIVQVGVNAHERVLVPGVGEDAPVGRVDVAVAVQVHQQHLRRRDLVFFPQRFGALYDVHPVGD